MFDHVKFGVSDYAASKAFFLKALAPLGVTVVGEGTPDYGVELSDGGNASLCLFQTKEKPAHLHIAFAARTRSIARPIVDLPEPLSPTSPRLSPLAIEKETSSTADTAP